MGNLAAEETPQIAYRFLDEYISEKEDSSDRKAAGIFGISLGGVSFAGAGVTWFFGDDISSALSEGGEPWDSTTKNIATGALAAGGVLSTATGAILLLTPGPDYRAEYAYIFDQPDPLLREVYAAAVLAGLAAEGRAQRLTSGWANLSIPIFATAARVATNLSAGREWHVGVFSISSTQVRRLASGLSSLLFKKSEKENLYEEYLAAQQAIVNSSK